jgi:hypothetical protein
MSSSGSFWPLGHKREYSAWQKTLANEDSPRVMRRADGPAEGDDSKETSTAVALLETDLTGNIRTSRVYQAFKDR